MISYEDEYKKFGLTKGCFCLFIFGGIFHYSWLKAFYHHSFIIEANNAILIFVSLFGVLRWSHLLSLSNDARFQVVSRVDHRLQATLIVACVLTYVTLMF